VLPDDAPDADLNRLRRQTRQVLRLGRMRMTSNLSRRLALLERPDDGEDLSIVLVLRAGVDG
jgi:hypothetical protein